MQKSSRQAHRRLLETHADDPLGGVTNLFDIALVFAIAILVALWSQAPLVRYTATGDDATIVTNPGQPNMEIIQKKGRKLTRYRASNKQLSGQGQKLGVAYRLANGDVVYVPNE